MLKLGMLYLACSGAACEHKRKSCELRSTQTRSAVSVSYKPAHTFIRGTGLNQTHMVSKWQGSDFQCLLEVSDHFIKLLVWSIGFTKLKEKRRGETQAKQPDMNYILLLYSPTKGSSLDHMYPNWYQVVKWAKKKKKTDHLSSLVISFRLLWNTGQPLVPFVEILGWHSFSPVCGETNVYSSTTNSVILNTSMTVFDPTILYNSYYAFEGVYH